MATQTLESVNKIIVMMPNWLGDAVMAMPLLGMIKDLYPQAQLTVLTPEHLAGVYAYHKGVDQVLTWPKSSPWKSLLVSTRALRKHKFDLGVLCPNSFYSALFMALSNVRYRLGYIKEGRGFLLNEGKSFPSNHRKKHQSHQFMALLFSLWNKKEFPALDIPLRVPDSDCRTMKSKLKSLHYDGVAPLIALGISSAYGPAKDWSAERYRFLGMALQKRFGAKVLLLGTAKDQDKARFIMRGCEHVFINLAGQTDLKDIRVDLVVDKILPYMKGYV